MKYPALIEQIAVENHVKPEQVLLGCGSTEVLRMAAFAFLGSGKRLIQASPTFEGIEHYARAVDSEVISIPLTSTFAHDLDKCMRVPTPPAVLYTFAIPTILRRR
jgi:histidinol-phosphate aminotransferase